MHSMSNNVEFMSYDNAEEVVNKVVTSFKIPNWFRNMIGIDFVFDSIQLLYYKCHKINFKCGSSYIDSPDWIKMKIATINPENIDSVFNTQQLLH